MDVRDGLPAHPARRPDLALSPARVTGIDHVQVAAPPGGEPRARAFYGDWLGLPELEKPPALQSRGGAWFRCGAQQLHVGVEDPFAPARKAHPALRVEGLGAMVEGREVTWDDAIPGVRRCYVDDPFGNRIELIDAGPRESG